MNWIKPLSSGQRVALALVLLLQLLLLLSVAQSRALADVTPQRLMLIGTLQTVLYLVAVQGLIFLVIAAILLRRFAMTALTISLLLFANFALTPVVRDSSYITLPKNMDRKLRITGDVMPGFTGISRVTTDDKGFRTMGDVDYASNGTLRIFAIGGSTTEQIHVSDEKTWTSLLQRELAGRVEQPVEVINTGVAGLRARHHHATLVEILDHHPDVVLFMMGLNDWNKHIVDHFDLWLTSVQDSWNFAFDRSLLWKGMQILLSSRASEQGRTPDGIEVIDGNYYATQNDSLRRPDVRAFPVDSVSDDYRLWVGRIIETCLAHDIVCVFINQPNAYQSSIDVELHRRLWMTPPNQPYTLTLEGMSAVAEFYNRWMLEAAREHGITTCEVASRVPATTEFFYDDCHFNEGGSKLVASLVAGCLEPLTLQTP